MAFPSNQPSAIGVDAANGPLDAAVELLEVWVLCQMQRKLDVLHQLVGPLAPPHALDRLVQDGLDAVAVRRERGARSAATQDGPGVARHHVLRSQLDHLLQTGDPDLGSTQPRAPDGSDVGERAEEVVSGHQDSLLRQPDGDRVHRLTG